VLGDPLLLRRLEAYVRQRAVCSHTHAQIVIQPHAMVWAAVGLSGEDSSLHAVQIGRWNRPPSVTAVAADPIRGDERERVFDQVAIVLERYFAWCVKRAVAPQLIVTSSSALEHLTNIAEDYRFFRSAPRTAQAARDLTYFAERAPIRGQQAVVSLAEVLSTHWVTPLPPSRERHLGIVLACIECPPGADLMALVLEAERTPMGPVTDPAFDADQLAPLLAKYRRAVRRRHVPAELQRRAQAIREVMTPVTSKLYHAIQRGVGVLIRAHLPPLPAVTEWQRQEVRAFLDTVEASQQGVQYPINDRAKLAAFRLVIREDAQANYEAAVVTDDAFGRARSVCTGQTLAGITENRRRTGHPTRRGHVHTFDVVTTQDELTVRPGDELCLADDPRLVCVVRDYRLIGGQTRVGLRVARGMNVPGVPLDGSEVTMIRAVPDWHRLGRRRAAMAERLRVLPWTHVEGGAAPATDPETPPTDLIRALEVLK